MDNNELLVALSDMLDEKLKLGLEPIKEDIKDLKENQVKMSVDIKDLKENQVKMSVDIKDLKENQVKMSADIKDLKDNQVKMDADIKELKARQLKTDVIIENELRTNVNLLVENFIPAIQRYDKAMPRIDSLEIDVNLIKMVVAEHSEKLKN